MSAVSRRYFVLGGASAAALATTGLTPADASSVRIPAQIPQRGPQVVPRKLPLLPSSLFKLGVASGDPLPDSVVLWTRLAPDPLGGGGLGTSVVPVRWQLATDDKFANIVQQGTVDARPELGHSVHIDTKGLRSSAWYFYRFKAGTEISPVGRTKTAPAAGSNPSHVRFAFTSCQNYENGYYVAYQDLAAQNLDFVAFLGDYIYESRPNPKATRVHEGKDEPYTLVQYRNRHARYRSDRNLQKAHAAFPWIVSMDDHEVDNDWAGRMPQDPWKQSPESFKGRRAAAFQAWYEHMPVRAKHRPSGTSMLHYRRFDFGTLVRLHSTDTRQYRTDQAKTWAEANDPARTMTGIGQERWLLDGLRYGPQRWNLIATQVPISQTDADPGPGRVFWMDPWDGYRVQRKRLLTAMGSTSVANPIVITGDRHFTMASDLRVDFDNPTNRVVAAELVSPSVTSNGDIDVNAWHREWDPVIRENPHWRYGDGRHGYITMDITRDTALGTLRGINIVSKPTGTLHVGRRFVVSAGRRGLEEA